MSGNRNFVDTNIALLSPSQNAYSETFIRAHKIGLKGNVYYYFSGVVPDQLESYGALRLSLVEQVIQKISLKFAKRKFTNRELAIYNSFKKHDIQVVIAEYGDTGNAILKVCQSLKIPLIVHFHGYDASVEKVIQKNNRYQDIFNYASYIIAVSRKMEQKLLDLGCSKNKLVYNVYGPKEEFLELKPQFSKPQFISIGRFVDKKAPYYTILAFKKLVIKFPEAKLIMAGNGLLLNMCKNLVNYHKLQNSIKFVGVISPKKYREYLEESLAFVQHSITALNGDSEGTPVAVLEASAAGIPVVSTKHAGIPDVIEDGKTGFLVSEHDVREMAQNMMRLIEDPNLAQKIGSRGKKNIKNNFTLQRHIDVLDSLITKCVN